MPSTPMAAIQEILAGGGTVLIDGATGTELERRGAAMDDGAWCAMATLTAPDLLRTIHEDYIRAGARVITTNTFSASRTMLDRAGHGDRFAELNRRAVEIALEARDRAGARDRVVVAGSMSHQVPVAAGTDLRDPDRVPPPEQIAANYRDTAAALAGAGVDLILMEMMSDPDLANPALAAARETGLPIWIGYSVRADAAGAPVAFSCPGLSPAGMLDAMAPGEAGAIGVMHSHADVTTRALEVFRERWPGPLMAYPDSGWFEMPNWRFVDIIPPAEFARVARGWVDSGVQIVGGCCGLGVEHIEALAAALDVTHA